MKLKVTHLGGGRGDLPKRWGYSISLFSKMGDKGNGGVKNLKKWVTSFMDGPKILFSFNFKQEGISVWQITLYVCMSAFCILKSTYFWTFPSDPFQSYPSYAAPDTQIKYYITYRSEKFTRSFKKYMFSILKFWW